MYLMDESSEDISFDFVAALDSNMAENPRLLRYLGCSCFSMMRAGAKHVRQLPFPFGPLIKRIEDKLDPWLHPLASFFQGLTLSILDLADDQIVAILSVVEKIAEMNPMLSQALGGIRRVCKEVVYEKRGVVGFSADVWVEQEEAIGEKVHKAMAWATKVPLLKVVAPMLYTLTSPLAISVSDWLVKHSKVDIKDVQTPCHKEPHSNPKGLFGEDIVHQPAHICMGEKNIDATLDDDEIIPAEAEEEEKEILRLVSTEREGDDDAAVTERILELIDNSWLLGNAL